MAGTMVDVTGLPETVVRDIQRLVQTLQGQLQPQPPEPTMSIFDLFGKAPVLRTGEDIAAQIQEERDAWGEP